jgi:hypothetical protein
VRRPAVHPIRACRIEARGQRGTSGPPSDGDVHRGRWQRCCWAIPGGGYARGGPNDEPNSQHPSAPWNRVGGDTGRLADRGLRVAGAQAGSRRGGRCASSRAGGDASRRPVRAARRRHRAVAVLLGMGSHRDAGGRDRAGASSDTDCGGDGTKPARCGLPGGSVRTGGGRYPEVAVLLGMDSHRRYATATTAGSTARAIALGAFNKVRGRRAADRMALAVGARRRGESYYGVGQRDNRHGRALLDCAVTAA